MQGVRIGGISLILSFLIAKACGKELNDSYMRIT